MHLVLSGTEQSRGMGKKKKGGGGGGGGGGREVNIGTVYYIRRGQSGSLAAF